MQDVEDVGLKLSMFSYGLLIDVYLRVGCLD